jgi:[ribosomal protein S18]-alanine N-acetyltransferase
MAAAVSVSIRPMTVADIPQVVEIEREAFPTNSPQASYRRELEENRLARYIVAVAQAAAPRQSPSAEPPATGPLASLRRRLRRTPLAESSSTELIAGFLGLWLMVDEAHIVTLAVREDHRRRGIGALLVARAIELAREAEARSVTLEVRLSNTGAQALYERFGFRRAGIRKRYYTDNGEDAIIMTRGMRDEG